MELHPRTEEEHQHPSAEAWTLTQVQNFPKLYVCVYAFHSWQHDRYLCILSGLQTTPASPLLEGRHFRLNLRGAGTASRGMWRMLENTHKVLTQRDAPCEWFMSELKQMLWKPFRFPTNGGEGCNDSRGEASRGGQGHGGLDYPTRLFWYLGSKVTHTINRGRRYYAIIIWPCMQIAHTAINNCTNSSKSLISNVKPSLTWGEIMHWFSEKWGVFKWNNFAGILLFASTLQNLNLQPLDRRWCCVDVRGWENLQERTS